MNGGMTLSTPRLVVVDVDTGVDDAWALLALLRAQRLGFVRILAILAASGNTDVHNVCVNTCRLLQSANAKDIPVYVGLINPMQQSGDKFFGEDGFGDLPWDWEPDMTQVSPIDGIETLNRLANQNSGEITLVCLAPLSNIAESIRRFPNLTSKLKEILIMGGNHPGNVSAEFNFLTDPLSADTVLSRAQCPVTILPVDTCVNINLTLPWRFETFNNSQNPSIQMFNRIEQKCWKALPEEKTWWECDLFLACGIINGTVFRDTITTYARVQVDGPRRGQLIVDPNNKHNVRIVTKINNAILQQEVLHSAET